MCTCTITRSRPSVLLKVLCKLYLAKGNNLGKKVPYCHRRHAKGNIWLLVLENNMVPLLFLILKIALFVGGLLAISVVMHAMKQMWTSSVLSSWNGFLKMMWSPGRLIKVHERCILRKNLTNSFARVL